jgi:hypothetical protein
MKIDVIKDLKDKEFYRLTGVQKNTFFKMVEILEKADTSKRELGGRPSKLSIPDQILATLEYLREYRTYFHVGVAYGISESTAYKTIKWVEDTLIKDGTFSLPGKKELLKSDVDYEIMLIDATESPIQRPKKNKGNITQAKRKDTH